MNMAEAMIFIGNQTDWYSAELALIDFRSIMKEDRSKSFSMPPMELAEL
ncbi:hypothetical protein [Leisingera thetidis]|nr:hypothetical protein [Leisingera thetidis]